MEFFVPKIKVAQNIWFSHRFSISGPKVTPKWLPDGPDLPLMSILAKTLGTKSCYITFLVLTMGIYHPILVKPMETFLHTTVISSPLCTVILADRGRKTKFFSRDLPNWLCEAQKLKKISQANCENKKKLETEKACKNHQNQGEMIRLWFSEKE